MYFRSAAFSHWLCFNITPLAFIMKLETHTHNTARFFILASFLCSFQERCQCKWNDGSSTVWLVMSARKHLILSVVLKPYKVKVKFNGAKVYTKAHWQTDGGGLHKNWLMSCWNCGDGVDVDELTVSLYITQCMLQWYHIKFNRILHRRLVRFLLTAVTLLRKQYNKQKENLKKRKSGRWRSL